QNPGEEITHVYWDTTFARVSEESGGEFNWYFGGEDYRTRPFRLEGEGYPTRVQLPPDIQGAVQVRYGRDVLLYGNMEDEGAQPWNLNSANEFYTSERAYERERSIKIEIPPGDGSYLTEFENRVQLFSGIEHSFLGWMATENAVNAQLGVLLYESGGANNPDRQVFPTQLNGTHGWTPIFADIGEAANDQDYVVVRASLDDDPTVTSEAWFDDVNFIWWEDWVDIDEAFGVDIPFPSGYRFAQIKTDTDPGGLMTYTQQMFERDIQNELDERGGPDDFGYFYVDSSEEDGPDFDWVEMAEIGEVINNMPDDDFQGPFDLPFDFEFYGITFDEIYISSNGYITFGEGSGVWRNNNLPNPADPNNQICVFRDDLNPTRGGLIYYGEDAEGRFVVQFDDIPEYHQVENHRRITCEIILDPDGTILLQYESLTNDIDNTNESIGIENWDGTIGLQVSLGNNPEVYPRDGLAIRFDNLEPNASVSGVVIDIETGDPIENALVSFGAADDLTDADGNYSITDLYAGDVTVLVIAEGYFEHFVDPLTIAEGENIINFELSPRPQVMVEWTREYPSVVPAFTGVEVNHRAMR
ncbi:carboxypeptidase-like regulatory domain-containing protein, partial [bacterium]|nr:carboxypeptidase-like regulatory domain-containing protein [bacterium]